MAGGDLSTTKAAPFVCEVCGRAFTLERALTRHRNYAHGPESPNGSAPQQEESAAPSKEEGGRLSGLFETATAAPDPQLDELVAPLRARAAALETELNELTAKRDQVRGLLGPIKAALKALEAGPHKPSGYKPGTRQGGGPRAAGPKPRKVPSRQQVSETGLAEVYEFIVGHQADFPEGFITAQLMRAMNDEGHKLGKDKVRGAVLTLHEQGRLRLVRKTRGGGSLYQLTAAAQAELTPAGGEAA